MRRQCVNCVETGAVVARSPVGEVVTVDDRYDCVAEPHGGNGVRQILWLMRVGCFWCAECLNRTETASSSALPAGDHEGGGAAPPAFVDVGAVCLLADGVQRVVGDLAGGRAVALYRVACRQLDAEPFGQPRSCARGQGSRHQSCGLMLMAVQRRCAAYGRQWRHIGSAAS